MIDSELSFWYTAIVLIVTVKKRLRLITERILNMNRVLPALALLITVAATADAQVPVIGKGDATRIDAARLPQPLKGNYEVMKDKCTKCHSMERIAVPFVTGVTPITGQPFDMDAMRSTTYNMVRKSKNKNNPISKDEAKSISSLLKYLLDESVK